MYKCLKEKLVKDLATVTIEESRLLSFEEIEKIPNKYLIASKSYWINNETVDIANRASVLHSVNGGGMIQYEIDNLVFIKAKAGVRPVVKIKFKNPDLKMDKFLEVGDVVNFLNVAWYYIGNDCLLTKYIIGISEFGTIDNDYENSVVRDVIEDWIDQQLVTVERYSAYCADADSYKVVKFENDDFNEIKDEIKRFINSLDEEDAEFSEIIIIDNLTHNYKYIQ